MINCAHPTHFVQALEAGEHWLDRVKGVKANASTKKTRNSTNPKPSTLATRSISAAAIAG